MAKRRRRERMHLNAEINVVSLIDVMLLLLVIFMLTAPMMQTGLDIHLPEVNAKPTESKSGLTVSIDANRQIYINDVPVTMAQFAGVFPTYIQGKEKEGVNFHADSTVSYGTIVSVLAVMRENGVNVMGFVTVPQRFEGPAK